ncbi:hypothetical protein KTH02_16045 [Acinetobacter radioresistens]|uniref:hypothetical protein n=1 Tax=Acinetobacter radioresistens TaxID=40216 RepID=UPI0021CDAAD5|nr:hypothetical protein [Acinetobacter radioresistens]MCU4310331.1 hypothetical protein [Acinetobacter radioresistens]
MAKLTLTATKQVIGVGSFVEKTIQFRDKDGAEVSGEVLIKIVSHDELVNASDVWKLKNKQDLTLDQLKKALVFLVIHEDENTKFFPKLSETGTVSTEVIEAMYAAADEVLDFAGKNWIYKAKMNSSANSSSMESVEEQLPKPDEI